MNGGKNYSPALDTYLAIRFRRDDPRAPGQCPYWSKWWSIGRDGWLKGYAAILLGETDVGL